MEDESKVFQTFFYQGNQIRTVEHNGETWWVASDVCNVLEHSDTSVAVSRLDDDEKLIQTLFVSGQNRNMLCVNEPGLYALILTSRTPKAKAFGRWIRHEVLPAIRKTGSYSLPQQEPQQQQPSQEMGRQVSLLALSKDELIRELQHSMSVAVKTVYNYRDPILALSKDASSGDLHYLRTILAAIETIYNYKYSQMYTSEYPQSEYPQKEQKPHPTETIVIPPVDTKRDVQTILLDYLHKTGTSITVRQLQQSGPRLLRNLPADHLRAILQALVESGVLTVDQVGKSEHYRLL